MEPLNDDDLTTLLRPWKAPATPGRLQPPTPRRPWYTVVWTKSVTIPVPVLALLLLAMIALQMLPRRDQPQVPAAAPREIRLSDFEPVGEAKPVVLRRTQYENR